MSVLLYENSWLEQIYSGVYSRQYGNDEFWTDYWVSVTASYMRAYMSYMVSTHHTQWQDVLHCPCQSR